MDWLPVTCLKGLFRIAVAEVVRNDSNRLSSSTSITRSNFVVPDFGGSWHRKMPPPNCRHWSHRIVFYIEWLQWFNDLFEMKKNHETRHTLIQFPSIHIKVVLVANITAAANQPASHGGQKVSEHELFWQYDAAFFCMDGRLAHTKLYSSHCCYCCYQQRFFLLSEYNCKMFLFFNSNLVQLLLL